MRTLAFKKNQDTELAELLSAEWNGRSRVSVLNFPSDPRVL